MSLIMNGTERDKLMIENNQFAYLPEAIQLKKGTEMYTQISNTFSEQGTLNKSNFMAVEAIEFQSDQIYYRVNGAAYSSLNYSPLISNDFWVSAKDKIKSGVKADCLHLLQVSVTGEDGYYWMDLKSAFDFVKPYKYCWLSLTYGKTTDVIDCADFKEGRILTLYGNKDIFEYEGDPGHPYLILSNGEFIRPNGTKYNLGNAGAMVKPTVYLCATNCRDNFPVTQA